MGRKAGSQFLGYKFYLGMVMTICHAPIDFVTELIFGEKSTWSGQETDNAITIDKKDLFGGKDKEGGVAGTVTIYSGMRDQGLDPYVEAFRGETSAQRGLLTLVFGNRGSVSDENNNSFDWDRSTISETVYEGILQSVARRIYGKNQGYKWKDIENNRKLDFVKVLKIIAGKETGEITDEMVTAYLQEITSGNRRGIEFKRHDGPKRYWNRPERDKDPLDIYHYLYGSNKAVATGVTKVIFVDQPATVNEHGSDIPNGEHTVRFPLNAFFGRKVHAKSSKTVSNTQPFYWGNTPYFKPVWVRVQAINNGWTHGIWYAEKAAIDGGVVEIKEGEQTTSHKVFDMNPAHIIYKTLTNDDWGMGYHPSDLDDDSFQKAADKLYDEGFGMSILWDSAKTIEDFNAEILDTIDGVIRVNVITGKFELILIRNYYNVDELPVLDENSIVEVSRFERSAWGDGVNEIVLTYKDRNESDVVLVKQNLAAIEIQRGIISSAQTYKGVHTKHVAELIAERELKLTSSSIAKMSIKINRLNYLLQNGDVFVLKWKALGIEKMVCRVASIVRGEFDDGSIEIEAMEDVFGLSKSSYTPTEDNTANDYLYQTPRTVKPIQTFRAIEASYHDLQTITPPENLNSVIRLVDGGSTYMLAMAGKPSAATMNYDLYASNSSNGGRFQKVADDVSFNPTFRLLHDVEEMLDSFGTYSFDSMPSEITDDMYIIIGDECMGIERIDPDGRIIVRRGILDTLPHFHAAGDLGFIVSVDNSADRTNYAVGSTLTYKTVSQGVSSQTHLDDTAGVTPKLIGRAARPAPVNSVRINDMFYPTRIDRNKPATITWQTRNRKQMIPRNVYWGTGSVTPEEGQTTNLRVFDPMVEGDAGVIYELKNTEIRNVRVEPIPKQAELHLSDLGRGLVYHFDLSKESKLPVQGTNRKPLVVHSDDVVAGAIEGTRLPSLGLNNYIEIPFDDALNSNTFTVIVRVKLTANSVIPIFTIGEIGDDVREVATQRFALAIERGLMSVSVGGDSPAYLNGFVIPPKRFDGDFHDVAVTLNLNEGRMEAFLDGVRLINKETPVRFLYNPSGAENLFSIREANQIARSRTDDLFGIGELQLVSDIIGVSPNTKYSLSAEINTQKDNGVLFYQIYDANKRPISDVVKHTSYSLNSNGLKERSVIFTTPANAMFIRVGSSHLRNGLGRLMFAQSDTKPEYNLQERDRWLYELPLEFPAYLGVCHNLTYDSFASRDSAIHDFVLYNRVLSAAEIRRISNRITRRAFPAAVGFELETMRDNLKSWQKFRWIVETVVNEEED
jgi:hypothetical protein|nr:MAG TPA: tail protein [Caudoviricetes sp.]